MLAIIDYGAGNLRSVYNAVSWLGCRPEITSRPDTLLNARAVILPGVGAAADTMRNLEKSELVEPVRRLISEGRPFFGVCIGLQILFTCTEEGGLTRCLGVIPGKVKRLPHGLKVPHMGWNQVKQRMVHPLFEGIPDLANFYFVHSYYPGIVDAALVAGETEYGVRIPSVIIKGNLVATQFHPEKSGEPGLRLYANFLKMAGADKC
ncbi:MAG: imidazole glycerol phosphate synthase subunit HisH [Chloroflexi bacterium]|nr:imidazole glycerol phosphate synthase subunit HisH [Chloroflexota bacterium]